MPPVFDVRKNEDERKNEEGSGGEVKSSEAKETLASNDGRADKLESS
jgi:hypothetical protein